MKEKLKNAEYDCFTTEKNVSFNEQIDFFFLQI